ncbi:MAG: hypothetical protein JNM79_24885 [Burkholderiales bacterium]|nr:hypothetical protein [Burkholderiales bacterium]
MRVVIVGLALGLVIANVPASAQWAPLDCERARLRLNRILCSDPQLTQLDRRVHDAFAERMGNATPAQQAHLRERQRAWRRARGLFDTGVEALTHEYRIQLAWLLHPLLAIEGRYERESGGASLEVEVHVGVADGIALRGLASGPPPLAWLAAPPDEPGAPRRTVRVSGNRAQVAPELLGSTAPRTHDCVITLEFSLDTAHIATRGVCGGEFSGVYRKAWLP